MSESTIEIMNAVTHEVELGTREGGLTVPRRGTSCAGRTVAAASGT